MLPFTYGDLYPSMASTSQPTTRSTIGSGGERNHGDEEQATSTGAGSGRPLVMPAAGRPLVMPEDGYEWKKYGQKFIKNIQKIRSYFRCRDERCGAKKKVEWHPRDPRSKLRIVYDGKHQHGSTSATAGQGGGPGGAAPNQYDLSVQYFGGPRTQ